MGALPPNGNNLGPSQQLVSQNPYEQTIRGENGPFQPASRPGNYGRNAHANFKQAEALATQTLDNTQLSAAQRTEALARLGLATIRYNPETAPTVSDLVANARGYAAQDILDIGFKKQGKLDREELTASLGEEAAEQQLKAEDLNEDGYLDLNEHTLYILYSDNAPQLISGTLAAYASQPESFPGNDPAILTEYVNTFDQIPSQMDGQITGAERYGAERSVMLVPNFVKVTMRQMGQYLNIPGTQPNQPIINSPITTPTGGLPDLPPL